MKKFKRGLALILAIALVVSNAVYSMSSSLKANELEEAQTQDMQAADQSGENQTQPEINTEGVDVTVPDQGQQTPEQNTQEEAAEVPNTDQPKEDQPEADQPAQEQPEEAKYNIVVNKPVADGGTIKAWTTGEKAEITYDENNQYRQEIPEGASFGVEITAEEGYSVDKVTDQNGSVIEQKSADQNVYTYEFSEIKENKEINVLYKEAAQKEETPSEGTDEGGQLPENRPAKELSQIIQGVKITVSAPEGVLEEGWTLHAKEVSAESVKETVEGELSAEEKISQLIAFDITLKDKEGNELQPDGGVSVTFENVNLKGSKVNVYHIQDEQGKAEEVSADVSGNQIAITAEHFSTYVLAGLEYGPNSFNDPIEIEVGETVALVGTQSGKNPGKDTWNSYESKMVSIVSSSENKAFVKGLKEGSMALIQHGYTDRKGNTQIEYFYVEVIQSRHVTVQFDINGGAGIRPEQIDKEKGDFVSLPSGEGIIRKGYELIGWCEVKNSSLISKDSPANALKATVYELGGTYQLNKTVTLYAAWAQVSGARSGKISIGIRQDGTVPPEPSIQYADYKMMVEKYTIDNLLDYFNPAHTVAGSDVVSKTLQPDFYAFVNSRNQGNRYWNGATQYVEWYVIKEQENDGCWHIDGVVRDKSKVNLDYDANCTDYSGLLPEGHQYTPGERTNVASCDIVRPGYTFSGWNTKADGSGKTYMPNDRIDMTESIKLFAQWAPKNSTNYTVEYYWQNEDGTYPDRAEDKVVLQATTGTTAVSDKNAKTKDGYVYDSENPLNIRSGTVLGDGSLVLKRYYRIRTDLKYTVKYLENESNTELAQGKTIGNQKFGTTVNEDAISINGYTLVGESHRSLQITEGANEIIFYYAKRADLSYTVNYIDKVTGDAVKTSDMVGGRTYLEEINVNAPDIDGYTKMAPTEARLIIGLQDNVITFYYEKRTDLSYTVNYLDKESGQKIADSKVVKNKTFGQSVPEAAIDIAGYDKLEPSTGLVNITADETQNVINFYYMMKTDLSYTVKYLEAGSNKELMAAKHAGGQKFGAAVTEEAEVIPGYNVSESEKSITIQDGANEIIFLYTKQNDLSYVVNYLEEGTNKVLAEAGGESGKTFEDVVEEHAVNIDGYVAKAPTSVSLKISADNSKNVINFYYTKRADLSYTVNYLELGSFNKLKESKTVEGKTFGDVVTEDAASIIGYNPTRLTEELTIDISSNVINFYYVKKADLTYTVNYYEKGTANKLADSDVKGGQIFGKEVTVAAKDLRDEGYVLDGDESVTFSIKDGANVVDFYYTKRTDLSYTIRYLEQGTNVPVQDAKKVDGREFQSSVTETAPDIEGFNKVEPSSATITIGLDENVITFFYARRTDLKYTINYLERESSQPIQGAKIITGQTFGSTATENAPDLATLGYDLDGNAQESINISADNDNNVINFYYTKRTDLSYDVKYLEAGTDDVLVKGKTVGKQTFGSEAKEKAETVRGYNLIGKESRSIIIGTGKNEIIFYYEKKNDLGYVVNYLEEGTNSVLLKAKAVTNQKYNDKVTESAEDIDGYTANEPVSAELIISEESSKNVINFYYTKRSDLSYTVNYIDKATGDPVAPAKAEGGQIFGSQATEYAIDIEGYDKVEPVSKTIDITTGTNEATFYYTKRTDLSYSVKYLESGTNQAVAPEKNVEGRAFKEIITENAVMVAGYNQSEPTEVTFEVGVKNEENIVIFYYTKKTDLSYTVNYLDQDSRQPVKEAKVVSGQTYQSEVEESAVDIDGYTKLDPLTAKIIITENSGSNVINFYYTKRTDLRYTVNYLEEGTNIPAADAKVAVNRTFGESITEYAIDIPGYNKTAITEAAITVGTDAAKNVINFYYTKKTDLSYTVKYLEAGTNEKLADEKTENGQTFGESVTENAISITGYNVVGESEKNIAIQDGTNEIVFYYAKQNDLSYTVNYLEQGTNQVLKEAKSKSGMTFKDKVTEEAADIEGFVKPEPASAEIIISEDNAKNVINFYYTRRADISYTVNYVDKAADKAIADAKTVNGQTFGNTVSENAIDIAGYDKIAPVSQDIKITTGRNEITFYYTKRTDLSYTVRYLEKSTEREVAADKVADGQTFESEVSESAITVMGYNAEEPTEAKLTISADSTANLITFYYTKKADLSYTVNYLDQDSNEPVQAAKTVEDQVFQSTVKETAPDVDGYVKSGPVSAELIIKADNKENVINFYYTKRTDLNYSVNYLEKGTDTKLSDTKTVGSQVFGSKITEEAIDIDGYNKADPSSESVIITTDSSKNVITFYYTKRTDLSYNVKYLEAGTEKDLVDEKSVGHKTFGDQVTERAAEVKGYNLVGNDTQHLTVGTGRNEIVFYYTKKNDLSYVVNYLEEGTNEILADAKSKTGLAYQDEITEEAITIDGYASPAQSSAKLVISEDNSKNVINFFYTKRADLSYTVNYKEKGTDVTVAPSKSVNNQTFGSKITENAIDVDGYNMEAPVTSVVEIGTGTNEVTFYYTKRTDLSYTVRYLEAGTQKEVAGSLKAENQTFGSEVEEYAVDVPGYNKLEPVSAKLIITSDSSANLITFYYAKRTDLSYTVNYLDQDSRQPVKESKIVGSQTFQSEAEESAADIDGYTKAEPLTVKIIITENSDSNVINFYYAKRTDLSYTVNYLEEGTNTPVVDAKVASDRTFGETITENAIEVPGYNKTAVTEETIILGTDAAKNVINFYYAKMTDLSYTVKYLEAGTDEKLADEKTENGQTFGESVTENAISIPGYNAAGETMKTITIQDGTNEIVFYYAKQNDLSYTVNYLEQGTNQVLKDAKSETGLTFKDKVTEEAPDIEGYVKPEPASAELIISEDNTKNVINFYYTKRTDLSYTVNYVDKDTDKAIAEAKTVKGQIFGAVVSESAIDIAGYEKNAPVSQDVKITTGSNEITFYYAKRTDLSYTVKYLEKGTEQEVAKSKTADGQTFRDEVNEAAIDVAGYNAEMPTTAVLTIQADSSANVIVFYYTKKSDLSYTVNYLDQDTNEPVMKAKTVEGQIFQSLITETAPDADGYIKAGETTKSLTIGAYSQDNVINFYYAKRTDLSYTVNYFEKGTDNKVADSKTIAGQTFGVEITESAVDVTGYNRENPISASIKISADQAANVLNFYYTKKVDLSYTVKYLEEGTEEVLAPEKLVNNQMFGDNATEKAVEISGYSPTTAVQIITIQDGINEIIFTYTKKTDLSYTVKYLEADTNTVLADEKTVGGQTFNESVSETAADIAGYKVVGEVVRSLIIQDGTNEIIFYYTKQNDLAYTVNYLESGTEAALAQPKAVGGQTFQSEVTEQAADIDGYVKAEPSEAKLIISEDNAKNVINFYYTKRTDLSYSVNYLEYGTGSVLHESKTVEGQTFGTTVTETAEAVDGYYAVQVSQELKIQTGSNVINFYYMKRADLSYQVHYYLDGEEQSDLAYTAENQVFGTEISKVEDKMPAGYILEKTENLPLQIGTGANEIRVFYTLDIIGEGENPDEGDGIPDKYQVVVNYEAVNGTVDFAKTVVTLLDEQGNPSENGTGTLNRIASASANDGYDQESLNWTPGTPVQNMEIKEATTFTAAFTAVPVTPVTPENPGTTPGNPTAPGTPTQPTTPGTIYRTITQPITELVEAAGEAIDANVQSLVPSDDEGVPLANKASKDHKCCILHFLLLLLALGVEIAYTRSMKKRQQRIFELQEELALTEQEMESNKEDIVS